MAKADTFEVPEEVRAFAEKGVLQARDNYAKFKEAAQDGNGAIEAVFNAATKGAHAYSAKLLDFGQANTSAGFDFCKPWSVRSRCLMRPNYGAPIPAINSEYSQLRPRNLPN